MSRIYIAGGIIVDGTGNMPFAADVLIDDDRIVKIDTAEKMESLLAKRPADFIISAEGKVVTPGFVDIHRHHDAKPLMDPAFGKRELAQGITSAVSGNCGISIVPRPEETKAAKAYFAFEEPVMGPIDLHAPVTYKEYLQALQQEELPLNTAAMIGTGAVRVCVKGFADTPFTREELEQARSLVEDAMQAGAPGVSLGIMYLPECFTTVDEYAYILEPVGRYHRVITAHVRGEGDSLCESIREVISIAQKAGCALEISHFKSCGMNNWGKEIHKAIAIIEEARNHGVDVTVDFYPYEGGSTALTTMLPPCMVKGDITHAIRQLGNEDGIEEFCRLSRQLFADWDNYAVTLGWNRILISGVACTENLKYVGMTVKDAAQAAGYDDPAAFAAYLMYSDNGKTAIINMSMSQEDIDTIAKLPYASIISDSIYAQTDTPHPRMYGAFPKVIRQYVNQRQLYSLQEAVHRMSSMPAKRMELAMRGELKEGWFADVLVFDPDEFTDHATYEEPARISTGLAWGIINGNIVWNNGKMMSRSAGRVLTAESSVLKHRSDK